MELREERKPSKKRAPCESYTLPGKHVIIPYMERGRHGSSSVHATCVPLPECDIYIVYIFDLLQGFTYLLCIGLRVGVVAITINANDYK